LPTLPTTFSNTGQYCGIEPIHPPESLFGHPARAPSHTPANLPIRRECGRAESFRQQVPRVRALRKGSFPLREGHPEAKLMRGVAGPLRTDGRRMRYVSHWGSSGFTSRLPRCRWDAAHCHEPGPGSPRYDGRMSRRRAMIPRLGHGQSSRANITWGRRARPEQGSDLGHLETLKRQGPCGDGESHDRARRMTKNRRGVGYAKPEP
jgi:hypothetical protein